MNGSIFAALFSVIFLFGAVTMLMVQPSGLASAGLAAGFMLPVENISHVGALLLIGLTAAWLGHETIMLLPLCSLLMLIIGGLMQIDEHQFHAIRAFTAGSIILFSLCVSMFRNKIYLLSIPPVAIWVYFAGTGYMSHVPDITTPLHFLIGTVICAALLMGIGVSLGITLTEHVRQTMEKLRTFPAVTSFLSFF